MLAAACGSSPVNPNQAEASPTGLGPVQTEPGSVSLPNPEEATLSNPEVLGSLLPDTDSAATSENGLLVATAASSQESGDATSLTLAHLLATTGDLAVLAAPLTSAIQMAVFEANQAGYQQVELQAADTGSNLTMAAEAAFGLAESGVAGVIGTLTSEVTAEVIDTFNEAQIPLVSPASTAPGLTGSRDDGYFFRTSPSDSLRGKVLGDVVAADGATNVAVVYRKDTDGDTYGSQLAEATTERLESHGLTVAVEIELNPEAEFYEDEISQLRNSDADAVVLITFEEGTQFLAEWMAIYSQWVVGAAEDRPEGAPSSGSSPWADASEADAPGSSDARTGAVNFYLAEQLAQYPWEAPYSLHLPDHTIDGFTHDFFATLPGIGHIKGIASGPTPNADSSFAQRFRFFVDRDDFTCSEEMSAAACEAAQNMGPFAAEAYDAAVILLLAKLQAKAAPLAEHISQVTKDGIKCFSYIDCAALMLQGADIDYEGASGQLDFGATGEPEQGTYRVWEINDLLLPQIGSDSYTVSQPRPSLGVAPPPTLPPNQIIQ